MPKDSKRRKWITNQTQYKWDLLYHTYKRATGKRREVIRDRLLEIIFYNKMIEDYNK